MKIERAILSCYDKTGVVDFARALREFDIEIVSTSGTLSVLEEARIEAVSIADFTGVPEMMDGRVKTLHPKIHAGLLGLRDSKLHCEQMQAWEMQWVDLVVVNLQPLAPLMEDGGRTTDEIIEQIDIGGTAMIRSAAKNFRYVTVVVNPQRYTAMIHEMRAHEGEVPFAARYRLAQEAFACTAEYDRAAADYLQRTEPSET
jgi:phosphoribosylaminoimidazolecarboxamide formyltransferase / IMP cyclohydrolase